MTSISERRDNSRSAKRHSLEPIVQLCHRLLAILNRRIKHPHSPIITTRRYQFPARCSCHGQTVCDAVMCRIPDESFACGVEGKSIVSARPGTIRRISCGSGTDLSANRSQSTSHPHRPSRVHRVHRSRTAHPSPPACGHWAESRRFRVADMSARLLQGRKIQREEQPSALDAVAASADSQIHRSVEQAAIRRPDGSKRHAKISPCTDASVFHWPWRAPYAKPLLTV